MSDCLKSTEIGIEVFTLKGHSVAASVTLDVFFDESGEWGDIPENERDDYGCYSLYVRVEAYGVTGADSLGGVYSKNCGEFSEVIKEHDMVKNAIKELKSNLLHQAKRLRPFMIKGKGE